MVAGIRSQSTTGVRMEMIILCQLIGDVDNMFCFSHRRGSTRAVWPWGHNDPPAAESMVLTRPRKLPWRRFCYVSEL